MGRGGNNGILSFANVIKEPQATVRAVRLPAFLDALLCGSSFPLAGMPVGQS